MSHHVLALGPLLIILALLVGAKQTLADEEFPPLIIDSVTYADRAVMTKDELVVHLVEGTFLIGMTVDYLLVVRPILHQDRVTSAQIDPESGVMLAYDNVNASSGDDALTVYQIELCFATRDVLERETRLTDQIADLETLEILDPWPLAGDEVRIPLSYISETLQEELRTGDLIVAAGNEVGDYSYLRVEMQDGIDGNP